MRQALAHRLTRLRPLLAHPVARGAAIAGALVVAFSLWAVWPYLVTFGDIPDEPEHQPSRLYGSPLYLWSGKPYRPALLVAELRTLGYRAAPPDGDIAPGRFRRQGERVTTRLRKHMTPEGPRQGFLLEVTFGGGAVRRLRLDGRPVRQVELPAPLLASYYDEGMREVLPVVVDELPQHVVDAVLAAEDASFRWHLGVSPTGVARAAWVNLREKQIAQGGSTLTQQLVKNVYLSPERSLLRKLREAALAFLVELQHPKEDILQAYLNTVYLGTAGGVNLHGFGAAARAYFGKEASELTAPEAALLAGMIRAPAHHDPLRHPEKARERRDDVLERMVEVGRLPEDELEAAQAAPMKLSPERLGERRAPYLADALAVEARERFGVRRLAGTGHHLFSTVSRREQEIANRAVGQGLGAVDGKSGELEAALLSVDPRNGAIRAYVGGRSYNRSQFDRVRAGRRQAGSAFKPVVFAAALERGAASPSTHLQDAPLAVGNGARAWRPENYDGRYRGRVTARHAMEQSLNTPMARLALATGIEEIADTGRRLGIEGEIEEVPALALGAVEVTPWEMATVYSTLAGGGFRPRLYGLTAVIDGGGRRLEGEPLPAPESALDPRIAYVTTSVLTGVVDRGTGRAARGYGVAGPLAGKTGTSNDAVDSWFVGYRPDRVTVTWVGYDDPRPTRLSGARAALPLWGRFSGEALAALPAPGFRRPPGVVERPVCAVSGLLPRPLCPTLEQAFLEEQVPGVKCDVHKGRRIERAGHGSRVGKKLGGWLKKAWKKLERRF